jgi:hypothetical protein
LQKLIPTEAENSKRFGKKRSKRFSRFMSRRDFVFCEQSSRPADAGQQKGVTPRRDTSDGVNLFEE